MLKAFLNSWSNNCFRRSPMARNSELLCKRTEQVILLLQLVKPWVLKGYFNPSNSSTRYQSLTKNSNTWTKPQQGFVSVVLIFSYLVECGTVGKNELHIRHKLANSHVLFLLQFLSYVAQPHRSLNKTGVAFYLLTSSTIYYITIKHVHNVIPTIAAGIHFF